MFGRAFYLLVDFPPARMVEQFAAFNEALRG
jgi:hypothetical protein